MKKILWVTPHCLLDTSNGAAATAREMLQTLAGRGFEIKILTATVMDSASGDRFFDKPIRELFGNHNVLNVNDGEGPEKLNHRIIKTASHARGAMTCDEDSLFFVQYVQLLDEFKPDSIMTFGGLVLDMLLINEAKVRGIKTISFMFNGSYDGHRWYRDVDLLVTETHATENLYRERLDIEMHVTGSLLKRNSFIARPAERNALLFVTAVPAKGVYIVTALAWLLEKIAPSIPIIVVEGRGNWHQAAKTFLKALGEQRESFTNVEIIHSTRDMAGLYARTKLLLAPSLWYESMGRVIIEAMWNGIPAITTNRNGPAEVIGNSGVRLNLPEEYFKAPYTYMQDPEVFRELAVKIARLFESEAEYASMSDKAKSEAERLHRIEKNIENLIALL